MGKILEQKEFLNINNKIKLYGGLYANWKSSGCKGPIPKELHQRLVDLHDEVEHYLSALGRNDDGD